MLRPFHLERDHDISGVSGVGKVAEGIVHEPSGRVVLFWNTDVSSVGFYNSMDDLIHIHGHDGMTRIVFDDWHVAA